MKKIILSLAIALSSYSCYAQWNLSGTNIYNTNTGNVGIGITNPAFPLDISGSSGLVNVASSTGTNRAYYRLINSGNISAFGTESNTGGSIFSGTSPYATVLGSVSNVPLQFVTNNAIGMTILGNSNVGIGTTNPTQKLQVVGRVLADYLASNGNIGIGSTNDARIYIQNTTPSTGKNWNIISETDGSYRLGIFGLSPFQTITSTGNVGIGTIQPDQKLTVNGTIHSSAVKVDTSIPVPDYVFEKNYNPIDLNSLKTYLDVNHHLPEIPSAAEIEKDGLNLGDMNLKLLKKVEELTLYIIEKDKQLQEQQKQIDMLKRQQTDSKQQEARIAALEKALSKLTNNQ